LVDGALQAKFGLALNDLVARGEVKAPMVIGCEDFAGAIGTSATAATTAPPATNADKGTEGSDTASRSTTLEALLAGLSARARVATWVATEREANRGPGDLRLPMLAVVADGTAEMAKRIGRMLGNESDAMTHTQSSSGRHHTT
jgi:urocanate hydratase